PGRSGVHGGVHAGQRGDLAGEHGLVDREQHGAEVRRVAHVVEHRAQVVDVVHGDGDVEADVGPELLEDPVAVVAVHGGVEGHDQAVLGGQARLIAQQVAAQRHGLVGPDRAVARGGGEAARVLVAQACGAGIHVRVVGGDRAVVAEVQAAGAHGLVGAVVGAGVDPGGLAGGGGGERGVRGEVVDGVVGGRHDGDLELVEQCAGAELGAGELLGDRVVHRVGGARVQHGLEAEDLVELVLHPVAGGGAGVGVPV